MPFGEGMCEPDGDEYANQISWGTGKDRAEGKASESSPDSSAETGTPSLLNATQNTEHWEGIGMTLS